MYIELYSLICYPSLRAETVRQPGQTSNLSLSCVVQELESSGASSAGIFRSSLRFACPSTLLPGDNPNIFHTAICDWTSQVIILPALAGRAPTRSGHPLVEPLLRYFPVIARARTSLPLVRLAWRVALRQYRRKIPATVPNEFPVRIIVLL